MEELNSSEGKALVMAGQLVIRDGLNLAHIVLGDVVRNMRLQSNGPNFLKVD